MADSYLIDSNILLRVSRRDDVDYRIVVVALERLLNEGVAHYYTHQNIAEFRNVWTRPIGKNGFGLDAESADREIEKFESLMKLAADSAAIYQKWRASWSGTIAFKAFKYMMPVS